MAPRRAVLPDGGGPPRPVRSSTVGLAGEHSEMQVACSGAALQEAIARVLEAGEEDGERRDARDVPGLLWHASIAGFEVLAMHAGHWRRAFVSDAIVVKGGAAVLPVRSVAQYQHQLPDGPVTVLTGAPIGGTTGPLEAGEMGEAVLTLTGAVHEGRPGWDGVLSWPTSPMLHWPRPPHHDYDDAVVVSVGVLRDALQRLDAVILARATAVTPAFGAVQIITDGQAIQWTASDGHTLLEITTPVDHPSDGSATPVLVPAAALRGLRHLLVGLPAADPVLWSLTRSQVACRHGSGEWIAKTMRGMFPRYDRQMARVRRAGAGLELARDALRRASERAAAVSCSPHRTSLRVTGPQCVLETETTEATGWVREQISGAGGRRAAMVDVDGARLAHAVALHGERVHLVVSRPYDPIGLSSVVGTTTLRTLTMPLRAKDE